MCLLNVAPGEVVRSVFINTAHPRADLILFSLHAPAYSALAARRMPLASAAAGNAHDWTPLFGGAPLAWPGFVELDGVAGRGLTYDAASGVYRVWSLATYQQLFAVEAGGQVVEVRIGPPDLLLLVMQPRGGALPLRLLSFHDGSLLRVRWGGGLSVPRGLRPRCLLHAPLLPAACAPACLPTAARPAGLCRQAGVQALLPRPAASGPRAAQETAVALDSGSVPGLIELFGGHVLLMAAEGPLRIVDMAAGGGAAREVPSLGAPSALVHTPLNRCFLAFYEGGSQGVAAWAFDGRRLASLELPTLTGPHASTVFVDSLETLLLMWDGGGGGAGRGCVHAIDLQAGLAQIARVGGPGDAGGMGGGGGGEEEEDSLRSVTAIYYDEARQEMYTGSADGRIGVWVA